MTQIKLNHSEQKDSIHLKNRCELNLNRLNYIVKSFAKVVIFLKFCVLLAI